MKMPTGPEPEDLKGQEHLRIVEAHKKMAHEGMAPEDRKKLKRCHDANMGR